MTDDELSTIIARATATQNNDALAVAAQLQRLRDAVDSIAYAIECRAAALRRSASTARADGDATLALLDERNANNAEHRATALRERTGVARRT